MGAFENGFDARSIVATLEKRRSGLLYVFELVRRYADAFPKMHTGAPMIRIHPDDDFIRCIDTASDVTIEICRIRILAREDDERIEGQVGSLQEQRSFCRLGEFVTRVLDVHGAGKECGREEEHDEQHGPRRESRSKKRAHVGRLAYSTAWMRGLFRALGIVARLRWSKFVASAHIMC